MARISVNGNISDNVTSSEEIAAELAVFNSLVQEAVLVDGREFYLTLHYTAHEILPGEDNGNRDIW